MSSVIPKDNLINDVYLHKYVAANKMCQIMDEMDTADKCSPKGVIKTASSNSDSSNDTSHLIELFSKMLSALNMTSNSNENIKDVISKITTSATSATSANNKQASIDKAGQERTESIKIVSKSIKDSHYQIDVSKDIIQKEGKKIFMVSCYARDAYLGRYLIKRNYFYTMDREKFADNSYNEIITKIGSLKNRYYNEIIDVSGIFTHIKQVLDGVVSEIAINEDSIGTSVRR